MQKLISLGQYRERGNTIGVASLKTHKKLTVNLYNRIGFKTYISLKNLFAHSSIFSNKYVTIGRKGDYMSKYKTTMYIVSTGKTMRNRLNQSLKVLISQLWGVCEGNVYFQHLYTRRIVLNRFSSRITYFKLSYDPQFFPNLLLNFHVTFKFWRHETTNYYVFHCF